MTSLIFIVLPSLQNSHVIAETLSRFWNILSNILLPIFYVIGSLSQNRIERSNMVKLKTGLSEQKYAIYLFKGIILFTHVSTNFSDEYVIFLKSSCFVNLISKIWKLCFLPEKLSKINICKPCLIFSEDRKYFLHSEMILQMAIDWANESQIKIWFYQTKIHEIWHLKVY